ncbi:hypothetical protein Tco_1069722, partial [Tanacetum coccineum]
MSGRVGRWQWLLDYDESIRQKVVIVLSDLACHELSSILPGTIKLVADGLHDTSAFDALRYSSFPFIGNGNTENCHGSDWNSKAHLTALKFEVMSSRNYQHAMSRIAGSRNAVENWLREDSHNDAKDNVDFSAEKMQFQVLAAKK